MLSLVSTSPMHLNFTSVLLFETLQFLLMFSLLFGHLHAGFRLKSLSCRRRNTKRTCQQLELHGSVGLRGFCSQSWLVLVTYEFPALSPAIASGVVGSAPPLSLPIYPPSPSEAQLCTTRRRLGRTPALLASVLQMNSNFINRASTRSSHLIHRIFMFCWL